MCGIAGAVGLARSAAPDRAIVQRLTDAVAHRGPNGSGLWVSPSGRACFGHRRLSVIDLAGGQQPMTAADGRRGIVFNGEIYNYVELRAELAAAGCTFATQSDTEVLFAMLARHGTAALDRLHGMFAFAAWDDEAGELIVARDRLGKKPFYFRVCDDILYFCSSLHALRRTLPGAWEVDPQAIDTYLTLGFIPAPATIYRDTWKLAAAHVGIARLDAPQDRLALRPYWSSGLEAPAFAGSYEDALAELRHRLDEAVRIRLRSDVPLGIYLSGGVDSSLVAAAAAQRTSSLSTFSIGFDDEDFDETARAREVSDHLGLAHHVFRVSAEASAVLPELVAHFGEPNADWSALPMWPLARETSRHVTVALGGDGGDEGFAGYNWYRTAARLTRLTGAVPRPLAGMASGALHHLGGTAHPLLGRVQRSLQALSLPDEAERFALLRSLFAPLDRTRLLTPAFRETIAEPGAATRALAQAHRAAAGPDLRRMRMVDQRFYLADDLMPKVDVTSMAFGLEVRAPLLDHRIFAFGLSLPDAFLIDAGGGKRILRDLRDRLVPGLPALGPKTGFTPPVARWLRKDLREQVQALAGSPLVEKHRWLCARAIAELVREHEAGTRDHAARLYALLVLDQWCRLEASGGGESEAGDVAVAV